MTTFTVTVQDTGVQAALNALAAKVANPQPFLRGLGDDIVERARHRFDTSTGPDGATWKANAPATLEAVARRLRGNTYRTKKGDLTAKGRTVLAAKKPLIGESHQLRQQINSLAEASSVTVYTTGVTAAYAAIQQFGGQAGRGRSVEIPARPFMPVLPDGTLYPQEQAELLAALNDWLLDGMT